MNVDMMRHIKESLSEAEDRNVLLHKTLKTVLEGLRVGNDKVCVIYSSKDDALGIKGVMDWWGYITELEDDGEVLVISGW